MTAGDFLLKVRFENLSYQVKQLSVNKQQEPYIQHFVSLMKDKKKINVKICSLSVPADIGLKNGEEIHDKKLITQLLDIAKKRAENFKNHVVRYSNIASSRLLLCKPKIDNSKNAQPRIELSV
jgi:hypothetical protein